MFPNPSATTVPGAVVGLASRAQKEVYVQLGAKQNRIYPK
jgi:hypothetical protein